MTAIRPNKSGVFPRLETGVHQVCLGNSSMFDIGIIVFPAAGLFVGIYGYGAYSFAFRADAGYVQDKLKLRFGSDAANIADLINDQLYEPGSVKRQGEYTEQLCAK